MVSAIVFVVGGFYVATPDTKNTNVSADSSAALSMQTIETEVSKGGQLIDVRSAAEYASGHIDGAINLSLQDIQQGNMPSVAKDKPIYVYCQSGNRSSQAASSLKKAGYQNTIDLGAIKQVQSIGGNIKS